MTFDTIPNFDFNNLSNQNKEEKTEEDPLVELAEQELENQLTVRTEEVAEGETIKKPDLTLEDLDVTKELFPAGRDSFIEETEKIGDAAQEINERIDEATNRVKEIFPKFKDALVELENKDFETNGIYTEKFLALGNECDLAIEQLVKLDGNNNFFVKQIGILTIMERSAKSLAKISETKSLKTYEGNEVVEETEKMGRKLLNDMEVLEEIVQSL